MKNISINKSEEAYEIIKQKILHNELKNGQMISEKQFAKELNMSRTPIRSAFQRLLSEGFIKIYPSRGAIIQEMSLKEARDIYDLRIAVETFVLKKTFELINKKDIENLKDIIKKQEKAFINGDSKRCMESMKYDMQFHSYFFNIYQNDKINQIFKNFNERFASFGYIALIKPGRIYTTLGEHHKIIDALENKDLRAAIDSLEQHLENGKKHILIR